VVKRLGIGMEKNLFEKYGGFSTVSRIVMQFYDKALDSDVLADYFEDIEMERLIDHQTKFVASLMGGPASYTDDMLKQLHAHLKIDDDAFDEMAKLFKETLEEAGLDPEDVAIVAGEIVKRRPVIVTAS
jgi:hemoglobin